MRRLLFGVLALIAGVVFCQSALEDWREVKALKDMGVVAQSEPIESYETRRDRRRTSYQVTVVLKMPSGQTVERLETVSHSFIERFRPGMRVDVRYLPNQPGTMEVVGEEPSNWIYYLFAVGVLLLGVGMLGSTVLGWRSSTRKP